MKSAPPLPLSGSALLPERALCGNGEDGLVAREIVFQGLDAEEVRLIADFSTENEKDASNQPVLRTC